MILPPIGLILFIFLGRNWKINTLDRKVKEQIFNLTNFASIEKNEILNEYKQIIKLLASNSYSPLFLNNKVTILDGGVQKFDILKEKMLEATDHIHLEYYIVKDDKIGNEIKDILIKKAKDGIKVRFVIDRVGSIKLSKKYIKDLKKAGVDIAFYSYVLAPLLRLINTQINYRNHRKIVIIDGKYAFIGGINIGDEYLGLGKLGDWKDCHIMIEGDCVLGLQSVFLDDFSIIKNISSGDEDTILKLKDSFMTILMKYLDHDKKNSIDLQKLSNDIKVLQSDKKLLTNQNNTLLKHLDQLNSYYDILIKKYDIYDSLSLKRVFDKEGEIKIEENSTKLKVDTSDNNRTTDVSVNTGLKTDSDVKNESSNTQYTSNPNSFDEKDTVNDTTDENSSKKFQDYEDKIIDLKNKIDSLQNIIKNLESSNKCNYEKVLKLETELLATNDRNKEIITAQDAYLNKIESLAKENNELNKINDSYLTKFQDLVKEREVFSQKVTESLQNKLDNLLKVNNNLEKDLVRIRTTRDDLLSKIAILESQTKKSELIEDITKALELSNEQWSKFTNGNDNKGGDSSTNNANNSSEQLLIKEIKDMEIAFKKLTALNNKKYMKLLNHESIISKLTIEKSKADQKYFASMRSKDSILVENKNLLKTVNKSNEFIVQLKDNEKLLQDKIKSLQD